eukprot:SM000181S03552  [mRNA]  locus=s181:233085:238564:- [translate_table: standard]
MGRSSPGAAAAAASLGLLVASLVPCAASSSGGSLGVDPGLQWRGVGGGSLLRPAAAAAAAAECGDGCLPRGVAAWQLLSELLLAAAFLCIPLQLLYFVRRAQVAPYRLLLLAIGAFLCASGCGHALIAWGYFGSAGLAVRLGSTSAKLLAALVALCAALALVPVLPDALHIAARTATLHKQACELDIEVRRLRNREQTARALRAVASCVRAPLDSDGILSAVLHELGVALGLESAAAWLPTPHGPGGPALELTHTLEHPPALAHVRAAARPCRAAGAALHPPPFPHCLPLLIPPPYLHHCPSFLLPSCSAWSKLSLPPCCGCGAPQVFTSSSALVISERAMLSDRSCLPPPKGPGWADKDAVAAVRLPLHEITAALNPAGTIGEVAGDPLAASAAPTHKSLKHAMLVLVLPNSSLRKWSANELMFVDAVAEEAVEALLHAAVREDTEARRSALEEKQRQLRSMGRDAHAAGRARNNFLAVMQYEMRTPMHTITALSSVLAAMHLGNEQRSMVDTVAKSSALLSTLANDILDFWRLDEDSVVALQRHEFELLPLLKDAETLGSAEAKAKGLLLILRLDPHLPRKVEGDSNRLLQVLLNVVGNSIKFTSKGTITVTVAPEKASAARDGFALQDGAGHVYLRVEVHDFGVEVEAADIPRLFEKFQQDEGARTGLGLALSRKFVQLMGGHVWIESEGPGKGTTCKLIVRLREISTGKPEEENGGGSDEGDLDVNFYALRVMVVDDNLVNRLVTRRLLDRIGCPTTVVDSGDKCLQLLTEKKEPIDVLLLDLVMPEMDGYMVCKRLHELMPGNERPKIVALTANADEVTREQCLAHGMNEVITKPISLNALRELLGRMLDADED